MCPFYYAKSSSLIILYNFIDDFGGLISGVSTLQTMKVQYVIPTNKHNYLIYLILWLLNVMKEVIFFNLSKN